MEKKLYKLEKGKVLCGVCAGLAEYLKLDVSIVRIIWVAVTLCGTLGLWLYLACALILPEKPEEYVNIEEGANEEG